MFFWKKLLSITLALSLALPVNLWGTPSQSHSLPENEASTEDMTQLALDFAQLEERVEAEQNAEPLSIDIFSLLPQKTLTEKIKVSGFEWQGENAEAEYKTLKTFHSWNKLTVKLVSEQGDERFRQNLSEFSNQTAGYGNAFKICDASSCRIELSKEDPHQPLNSKTVHQFFLEARQVAVIGPYILFTSKDSDSSLKFIDLHSYENLIGNDSIPVFEIPLNIDGGIRSLVSNDNKLVINNQLVLGLNHLEDLAPIYSALFNVSAHLVDPGAMAGATPLYANIGSFVEREFSSGKFETTQVDGLKTTLLSQEKFLENFKKKIEITQGQTTKEDLLKQSEKTIEAYEKWMKESEAYKAAIKKSQDQVTASRKFWAKTRRAFGYISKPLPESSGRIKRAIKIVIGSTLNGSKGFLERVGEVLNGNRSVTDLFSVNNLKYSAAVAGAVALSQAVPSSYVAFVGDGLLYSKELFGYFHHVLSGYWDAYGTSFKQVGSIYTSLQPVYDQYIDPSTGQWYKFLIGTGVFSAALAVVLGGYHIPRRLWDLVKDMRSPGYRGLIDRQNRIEQRFAKLVSEGEANQAKQRAALLKQTDDDEDETDTRTRLRQAQEDRRNQKGFIRTWASKIWSKKAEVKEDLNKIEEGLASVQQITEEDVRPIKTKWQAVKHLLLSTASYRATVGEYTAFFNTYASYRYSSFGWAYLPGFQKRFHTQIPMMVKVRPFGIAARLLYPEFFGVAVNKRSGRIVYPTVLNGGMTSLLEKGQEWVSRTVKRFTYPSGPEQLELFAELQDRTPMELKREIEKQKIFEDQIINIEEKVIEESLNASIGELTKFSKSDRDIRWLFTETKGVAQITSKQIGLLNMRNKVFVRSYMDLIYNEAMKEILKEAVEPLNQAQVFSSDNVPLTKTRDLKRLKKELIKASQSGEGLSQGLSVSPEKVKEIVQRLSQRKDLLDKAKSRAKWAAMGLPSFSVLGTHLKTEIAAALDGSQNPPMRNYEIVRQMREDEVAMARATRSEISTLFRTLPIDIAMKFLATAGITMGIMKPIQETFWGPNSVAYLSQYSFYGSLLAGIAFSSVAAGWGKLRQDYYDASDGLFGDIPTGDDAKGSYWKWFWKKWKSKENRLTKYWGNYIKIVFWNIPAAIPQIILLNYLFLGRFDMDAFIIGYISSFALPFSALFFKLDQVYEQSAYYAARGLKSKDLSDVEVQLWLQKEMQKLRNKFTVVRDLSLNPLLEAIANADVTPTESMGPRALARYLFGGYTPTEMLVTKMRSLSELSGSSVVKKIMDGCEHFLTNGNPDLIKIPKKGG